MSDTDNDIGKAFLWIPDHAVIGGRCRIKRYCLQRAKFAFSENQPWAENHNEGPKCGKFTNDVNEASRTEFAIKFS